MAVPRVYTYTCNMHVQDMSTWSIDDVRGIVTILIPDQNGCTGSTVWNEDSIHTHAH